MQTAWWVIHHLQLSKAEAELPNIKRHSKARTDTRRLAARHICQKKAHVCRSKCQIWLLSVFISSAKWRQAEACRQTKADVSSLVACQRANEPPPPPLRRGFGEQPYFSKFGHGTGKITTAHLKSTTSNMVHLNGTYCSAKNTRPESISESINP